MSSALGFDINKPKFVRVEEKKSRVASRGYLLIGNVCSLRTWIYGTNGFGPWRPSVTKTSDDTNIP